MTTWYCHLCKGKISPPYNSLTNILAVGGERHPVHALCKMLYVEALEGPDG